jgi:hypothetical protein
MTTTFERALSHKGKQLGDEFVSVRLGHRGLRVLKGGELNGATARPGHLKTLSLSRRQKLLWWREAPVVERSSCGGEKLQWWREEADAFGRESTIEFIGHES